MPNLITVGQTVHAHVQQSAGIRISCSAFQGHSADTDQSGTYDLLLVIHSSHGPVLYHFKGMISDKKPQISLTPVYLTPPVRVILGMHCWMGSKTRMMAILNGVKSDSMCHHLVSSTT